MRSRKISRVIPGQRASDGAGVKLIRSIGTQDETRADPFLMLDMFGTENPDDYIAGFPAHPHRGFETVTYMLDGHMLHEDHLGNRGDLLPGGAQWMRAGRGVIHSEMPQQEQGRMRGFQLWVNLPAREKMTPAEYRDIQADAFAQATDADGNTIRVLAGTFPWQGEALTGPLQPGSTDLHFADVALNPGAAITLDVPDQHQLIMPVFEGQVTIDGQRLEAFSVAQFSQQGEQLKIKAGAQGARLLVIAGKPIQEPIAQYGPFVMNTADEIRQAISDYQNGTLTEVSP